MNKLLVILHGMADSDSLLDKLPDEVEDIDRVKKEFEEKLAKEKTSQYTKKNGGILFRW